MIIYTPKELSHLLQKYSIDPKLFQAPPITSIHDKRRDADDSICIAMMRALVMLGADFLGVIGNRAPSRRRAEATRDSLDSLGLWGIPSFEGNNNGYGDIPHWEYTLANRYFREFNCPRGEILGAKDISTVCFQPGSTVLVCSAWSDLYEFIQQNPQRAAQLGSVVAMSGVELTIYNSIALDQKGRMIASTRASNNKFDQPAANFCVEWLQRAGVPLHIVTRDFVGIPEMKIPGDIFKKLEETEHPFGKFLKAFQWKILAHIWRTWQLDPSIPAEAEEREEDGLSAINNRALWDKIFFTEDTAKKLKELKRDDPFPNPEFFIWYDAYTLAICFPAIRERFTRPEVVTVRTDSGKQVNHYVYRSAENVIDAGEFSRFLQALVLWSLRSAV